MYIMGGAALMLLFGARQSTRDVDAVFIAPTDKTIPELAKGIAQRLNLPPDWLNDAAKGFVHGFDEEGPIVFSSAALRVWSFPLPQLPAMKLAAWRDDLDIADAKLLLSNLKGSHDEIWSKVRPYIVPGRELKARYAFDDLWGRQHGTT